MVGIAKSVRPVELADEAAESYATYTRYTIANRAIPDARDGLKPVHRRVLYGGITGGYLPTKQHRKVAKLAGEVMGNYHPHGDKSISDALYRLAQDFSMSVPLISA